MTLQKDRMEAAHYQNNIATPDPVLKGPEVQATPRSREHTNSRKMTFEQCIAAYISESHKAWDEALSMLTHYDAYCKKICLDRFVTAAAIAYQHELLQQSDNEIKAINQHLIRLSSLFDWAVNHQYAAKNIFAALKRQQFDEREPYTHAEVECLVTNLTPTTDARHWLPLLALYTGARPKELTSLHLSDIGFEQGIAVIDINENTSDKRLKSAHSKRLVPLHSVLLRLGFLEHAQTLRDQGKTRLFEMWSDHPKNGYWQYGGKWYKSFRKQRLGISKDFYSLRLTFDTGLRDAGGQESATKELLGQRPADNQSHACYAKRALLVHLKDAIDKLPVNPGRKS
jgi:integrase